MAAESVSCSTIRALMDVSHLLDGLNDDQRQAVASPLGAALVLAGAGSGKTRVLVHRVAWLIQVEGAAPHSILAVTFTNKAAAEMRSRIETLLGLPSGAMWLGTFHGLAHRLLRIHWREAGLPQSFQILDSEDQARLLRKVGRSKIRAAEAGGGCWAALQKAQQPVKKSALSIVLAGIFVNWRTPGL